MQCGEGGASSRTTPHASVCRLVHNHGEKLVSDFGVEDITNTVGLNYRMPNMEAAIAKIQLVDLTKPRVDLANHLRTSLSSVDCIQPCEVRPDCTHVYYFFPMKFDGDLAGVSRGCLSMPSRRRAFIWLGNMKPIYLDLSISKSYASAKTGFQRTHETNSCHMRGICPW